MRGQYSKSGDGRGACSRLLRRFRRDERATSAVEFALVIVPFLGILFAVFQNGMVLLNESNLEVVATINSRQIMTGLNQTTYTTCATQKQAVINAICPTSGTRPATALSSSFNCSNVIVDLRQSTLNNAVVTNSLYANPSSAVFNPATAGGINILRVIYPMPMIAPILASVGGSVSVNHTGQVQYNGQWVNVLMGTVLIRTEPYGAGGGGSC